VQQKDKVHLNTGAVSADLTGRACSPNVVHWTYDSWMLAHAAATSVVKSGGDTWFIIAPDYAFGTALTRDTTSFVEQAGGKVLGTVKHPFPGVTDFSSYLLQAQSSGAKVIGLANGGGDIVNCVKQAHEFGLPQKGIKLVAMVGQTTDAHAIGLEDAQGLIMNGPFYWDLNDRTRAFMQRVLSKTPNNYPNMEHAGTYSALTHYMKAIAHIGPSAAKASGKATVEAMKQLPTDDDAYGKGSIREDGRKIHPDYVFRVKAPKASRQPWDLYELIDTIPADQAFRPISEGGCTFKKT
jgi:branched-chain amino acid transport system substrate-binding protein